MRNFLLFLSGLLMLPAISLFSQSYNSFSNSYFLGFYENPAYFNSQTEAYFNFRKLNSNSEAEEGLSYNARVNVFLSKRFNAFGGYADVSSQSTRVKAGTAGLGYTIFFSRSHYFALGAGADYSNMMVGGSGYNFFFANGGLSYYLGGLSVHAYSRDILGKTQRDYITGEEFSPGAFSNVVGSMSYSFPGFSSVFTPSVIYEKSAHYSSDVFRGQLKLSYKDIGSLGANYSNTKELQMFASINLKNLLRLHSTFRYNKENLGFEVGVLLRLGRRIEPLPIDGKEQVSVSEEFAVEESEVHTDSDAAKNGDSSVVVCGAFKLCTNAVKYQKELFHQGHSVEIMYSDLKAYYYTCVKIGEQLYFGLDSAKEISDSLMYRWPFQDIFVLTIRDYQLSRKTCDVEDPLVSSAASLSNRAGAWQEKSVYVSYAVKNNIIPTDDYYLLMIANNRGNSSGAESLKLPPPDKNVQRNAIKMAKASRRPGKSEAATLIQLIDRYALLVKSISSRGAAPRSDSVDVKSWLLKLRLLSSRMNSAKPSVKKLNRALTRYLIRNLNELNQSVDYIKRMRTIMPDQERRILNYHFTLSQYLMVRPKTRKISVVSSRETDYWASISNTNSVLVRDDDFLFWNAGPAYINIIVEKENESGEFVNVEKQYVISYANPADVEDPLTAEKSSIWTDIPGEASTTVGELFPARYYFRITPRGSATPIYQAAKDLTVCKPSQNDSWLSWFKGNTYWLTLTLIKK